LRIHAISLYDMADGLRLFCKGAPEPVLALCHRVNVSGKIAALDDAARTRIVREQEAMAERGLRVLAFASKRLTAEVPRGGLEQALVFEGLAGLEDPPRADVAGIHAVFMAAQDRDLLGGRGPRCGRSCHPTPSRCESRRG
jgi:sodium/potassium-transporting ATPase subunit alpha